MVWNSQKQACTNVTEMSPGPDACPTNDISMELKLGEL